VRRGGNEGSPAIATEVIGWIDPVPALLGSSEQQVLLVSQG
jgi:hypothetical protein